MRWITGKSTRGWAVAGCLIAGCAGCGLFHQHPKGGATCPPYVEDEAVAENGDTPPPYPHSPTLHPVPTHPVFLPLQPDGCPPLPPGLSAVKQGATPAVEGPQIQIIPPTAEEGPASATQPKRLDRVTQAAPAASADPDASSWLFATDGLSSATPNNVASRKSANEGEPIRR